MSDDLIARLESRREFYRHDGEVRWHMSDRPDADCHEAAAALRARDERIAELEALVLRAKAAWDASHLQAMENGAAAIDARADAENLAGLLERCLPELDGEGATIHLVWAALAGRKG